MTEAAKLLFWDNSWDLREKECPCDVHFIEWLDREKITGSAIYHFGTGNHHHVGIECARENRRNSVLGDHRRAAGIPEIHRARDRPAGGASLSTTPSSATSIS